MIRSNLQLPKNTVTARHWLTGIAGLDFVSCLMIICAIIFSIFSVGLGDLGITCSPPDPRFAGSNPTEVDGFFHDVKILSTSPPGGGLQAEGP